MPARIKSLATLIRLQKQKSDALRRRLGELARSRAAKEQQDAALAADLTRELALAGTRPELSMFFGDFAGRIRAQREAIAEEIRALDREAEKLAIEVRAVFAEQKKFEITRENRLREMSIAREKKEAEAMDEAALQGHARKPKE